MKDSDFGSAPPVPPRRRRRKNNSIRPVASGAAAASVGTNSDVATIRSPRRPRLPPPPPPPQRRPRTIGSQNPSRLSAKIEDVAKVAEIGRSKSMVPEKSRSRRQDCEEEVLGNDVTKSRRSSGRRHREMVPIVTRMCREGVEKLQASLTTFRANLSPTKEKVERRSIYSSESYPRSNGYPPLFFTFQDFEDVMGNVESSTSRQLSNMTTFESPRTPKMPPDLNRFSSGSSETEDPSLLFRVTPTNLPFEKCLGPETTTDRIVEANRFIFEDYVDRRRKPLRSPSTKLVLFGDDIFDEADKDESYSSHTASRVRFMDDSLVSKVRDDQLFRQDEIGAFDSLQGVDSLPTDEAGDISTNSKRISPYVGNLRIVGGKIDDRFEKKNCSGVKKESKKIGNDIENEIKDDRQREIGKDIGNEICGRVEPMMGKNSDEKIGTEIGKKMSDLCETDEFGDVPFDSLIIASEDDPSSSGSAFSTNSKGDFQTILVRASVEPEPVSRRSPKNDDETLPNASTTDENTIVTAAVLPPAESMNSTSTHASIENLTDPEDFAEKSSTESVRQTFVSTEAAVHPEIGASEDAVNLRRNSFLKTMLRFEELEDRQSCAVVAAHPKTPVRASLSSNSYSKFQRVAEDTPNVCAAKEKVLDELSSNFSLVKLKPAVAPRERDPKHFPVDPRSTNNVENNKIYKTNCNVDSALECQVNPNISEKPITTDSRSDKKSQCHSDACSQKTDEFIDEHVETGSINAKKANLIEDESCDAAILESTSRNPDDVTNDKINNTNVDHVAESSSSSSSNNNSNNKHNNTRNNEDDNNGRNNNVNNNNNNNNNVGYCIDEVHQNKRNDTLEVESRVSIDKCAIVLRCKNNDNNSMTPVVLSPDQSSINNINNNSNDSHADDDGEEDTKPMTRGHVKSFVKFYEVKREPRDYFSSNDNDPEASRSGDDERTNEDTKARRRRVQIENDVAYTIVRRKVVPKNVVRSSDEQVNLASENSMGNDERATANGDADLCGGRNDDGPSNEWKTVQNTRSRKESTTTSATDVTPGNRKVDNERTSVGKQGANEACGSSSSGTSNHSVPKTSSSNIDERYTFYGTV